MDYDPQARPDPLIYVEPAPFEPGVGEGPEATPRVRDTALLAPAAAFRCPHRVHWWDLKVADRIGFVLVALLVYAAMVLALAGLPFGFLMAVTGLAERSLVGSVVGSAIVAIGALLLAGAVTCHRVWRRLHRPGLLICVLGTVTPPLTLAFLAVMVLGGGWPWLVLFVVPSVAVMLLLWGFRAVLYSGGTCRSYPWLPPKIASMLKR